MRTVRSKSLGPLTPGSRYHLISTMRDFRGRLLGLVADLDAQQIVGPRLPIVNPPLWEIGHVAWTQEFWTLRHLYQEKPVLKDGDQIYNSTDVAHDTRWELRLPTRDRTLTYMHEVFERAIARIANSETLSADEFYFYWLTTFHEAMHAEALAYTRQTLGYSPPSSARAEARLEAELGALPGDVEVPAGNYPIGATPDFPFVFDNEKWAHEVALESFQIARAPVTNGEFLEFVEEGGYREREYWSAEGWQWLESGGAPQLEKSFAQFFNKNLDEPVELFAFKERLDHPIYWKPLDNGRWQQRV